MRALGAALVLWGAGLLCALRRRESTLPLRVGQAVLADLAVLRYAVCVCRRPLPEICAGFSPDSLSARFLWEPLGRCLQDPADRTLPDCWAGAAACLPPPLDGYLAPLGPLLAAGGERLAAAIEETREEMTGYLRAEKARQAEQGRVTAALCLSGACLLILVLM
ncbi:MAG: hypothetical protein HFF73_03375 [Oscillospiraceae bacterium]|nr:hypothetical protein [Oscillospiraceae bacterium]